MEMTFLDRLLRFNRRVEAQFPPTGGFITVQGRRVHVLRRGPRGATLVVLIHGASGNVRDWEMSLLPKLSETHHVIAFDRPGFGFSNALPDHGWRLTDQIAHLRAALAHLGVNRFVLAGHSYGGSLAMRWAQDHPGDLAGLALISAPVMDWGGGGIGAHYHVGGRAGLGDLLAQLVRFTATESYLTDAIETVFEPQDLPCRYLKDGGVQLALRPHTFRTNSAMMLRLYRQMAEQAPRNEQVSVPLEIIHGDADTIVPAFVHAGPLSKLLPHARLTLMRGIGHMPHHEKPEAILAAINRLAAQA